MSSVVSVKKFMRYTTNELTRTFADTYHLVSVADNTPPSPVLHDHQLASIKDRFDMSAVIAVN